MNMLLAVLMGSAFDGVGYARSTAPAVPSKAGAETPVH